VPVHQPDLTPLTPEHGLLAALCFVRYLAKTKPEPPVDRTPVLVAAARHVGIPWDRIGQALGETGQYVHTIYRDLAPAPLPADFPRMTEPLDLEAELDQQRSSRWDDPGILIRPLIAAARHANISWQDIASALGLRRQTVHEKYRHLTPAPLPPEFGWLTHVCEIHHAT